MAISDEKIIRVGDRSQIDGLGGEKTILEDLREAQRIATLDALTAVTCGPAVFRFQTC
ncbi:MAG: hypothetical protein QGD92_11945 [Gammaproteobacteria bacterium]|nr:hypothetical protein [Gammaproteobacteria bacterium]